MIPTKKAFSASSTKDIRAALKQVRMRFKQRELAEHLSVDPKTLARWESGAVNPPAYLLPALHQLLELNVLGSPEHPEFKFIDLFAGIGGMRLGFEAVNGKCVYTSEWNKYSQQTYRANFGGHHRIDGDITKVDENTIPDHDVLVAGFPCQPFSIAGVSKKNSLGRAHGFACETQGTLFFDVARILKAKQPSAFLLENVKNLISHDKGRTYSIIRATLEKDLGYTLHAKIIDARHWTPQHRERIILVGFKKNTGFSWDDLDLPDISNVHPVLKDILHPEDGSEQSEIHFTTGTRATVDPRYTLSNKLWKYLQDYSAKHKAMGNGFGFGLVGKNDVARTLSARYYKDGSEILISRGKNSNPRRLTPRECSRLMGFNTKERNFTIPVSDTQAYKQFGNAVVVPVIQEVARIMKPHVLSLKAVKASAPEVEPVLV